MARHFPIFIDLGGTPPLVVGAQPALTAKLRLLTGFADAVNREWGLIKDSTINLPPGEYRRIKAHFAGPELAPVPAGTTDKASQRDVAAAADSEFGRWLRRNVMAHHTEGYANVSLSLKSPGRPPGDASASEMEAMADLADRYGRSELRVTYTQNIIIPHVRRDGESFGEHLIRVGTDPFKQAVYADGEDEV